MTKDYLERYIEHYPKEYRREEIGKILNFLGRHSWSLILFLITRRK
jgi:hypothetical protein